MEGTGLKIEEIFLAFTLLLVLAKLLGEAMERLGQPAILGEIAAGIILGSHFLGPVLFHTPLCLNFHQPAHGSHLSYHLCGRAQ